MKSTSILVLAAASATCITMAGCASSKPEPRAQAVPFDVDGDGYLTPEEYSASALSEMLEFDALDTDGDGLLSRRELEFRTGPGSRSRGPRGGNRPGGS